MTHFNQLPRIAVVLGFALAAAITLGAARATAQCTLTVSNTTACTLTVSAGPVTFTVAPNSTFSLNLLSCPPPPAFAVQICGVMQPLAVGGCCTNVVVESCCADVCLNAGPFGRYTLTATPAPGPCRCVC